MRVLVAILFVAVCATPALATPFVPDFSSGPVVFDFENGLQGWTTQGSAQRVNTQVLGGQWAIFGDGGVGGRTGLFLEIDLTGVGAISVEQFFAGGPADQYAFVGFGFLLEGIFFGSQRVAASNPGVWTLGLGSTGVHTLGIVWLCLLCDPLDPTHPTSTLGFIDNITLTPVPEPSRWLLGIVALAFPVVRRFDR